MAESVRLRRWTSVVATALFAFSIAFIVASATARRQPPPPAEVSGAATMQQIMDVIVAPSSSVVEGAVSGIREDGATAPGPQNEADWTNVAAHAAALAEAGNIMLLDAHVVDRDEWVTATREFQDAAMQAVRAAEGKDTGALRDAGVLLNQTCDRCHDRYQRQ